MRCANGRLEALADSLRDTNAHADRRPGDTVAGLGHEVSRDAPSRHVQIVDILGLAGSKRNLIRLDPSGNRRTGRDFLVHRL